jgi:outer membrane murein-binding lipoprotein Lpp
MNLTRRHFTVAGIVTAVGLVTGVVTAAGVVEGYVSGLQKDSALMQKREDDASARMDRLEAAVRVLANEREQERQLVHDLLAAPAAAGHGRRQMPAGDYAAAPR